MLMRHQVGHCWRAEQISGTHQLLVLHVDVCVRQLVLIFVVKDWEKKQGQGANKLSFLPFLILFTSICVLNARIKNSTQNFLEQHLQEHGNNIT